MAERGKGGMEAWGRGARNAIARQTDRWKRELG